MSEELNKLIMEICDTHQYLFEVISSRNPILKKIDNDYDEIKSKQSRAMSVKNLSHHITQFTKIPFVSVKIKSNSWTYSVFPIYNKNMPSIFKDKTKQTDTHKYVNKIYIVIGDNIINVMTSKELTALTLHELGHVEEHTSLLTAIISSVVGRFGDKLTTMGFVLPVIGMPLMAVGAITSYSARFFDRLEEYKSDNFATKNGYGEEMTRVLYKMKKIEHKKKLHKIKKMGKMEKFQKFLMKMFYPSEYPSDKKRVCALINKMMNDYKKQYPDLKKDMNVMFADLKC